MAQRSGEIKGHVERYLLFTAVANKMDSLLIQKE